MPLNIAMAVGMLTNDRRVARMSVSAGESDSKSLIFFIRFDIVGTIQAPPDTSAERLMGFANTQAAGLLWPYGRALAQQLTGWIGVQPIVLPTLLAKAIQPMGSGVGAPAAGAEDAVDGGGGAAQP